MGRRARGGGGRVERNASPALTFSRSSLNSRRVQPPPPRTLATLPYKPSSSLSERPYALRETACGLGPSLGGETAAAAAVAEFRAGPLPLDARPASNGQGCSARARLNALGYWRTIWAAPGRTDERARRERAGRQAAGAPAGAPTSMAQERAAFGRTVEQRASDRQAQGHAG